MIVCEVLSFNNRSRFLYFSLLVRERGTQKISNRSNLGIHGKQDIMYVVGIAPMVGTRVGIHLCLRGKGYWHRRIIRDSVSQLSMR